MRVAVADETFAAQMATVSATIMQPQAELIARPDRPRHRRIRGRNAIPRRPPTTCRRDPERSVLMIARRLCELTVGVGEEHMGATPAAVVATGVIPVSDAMAAITGENIWWTAIVAASCVTKPCSPISNDEAPSRSATYSGGRNPAVVAQTSKNRIERCSTDLVVIGHLLARGRIRSWCARQRHGAQHARKYALDPNALSHRNPSNGRGRLS
jgi:hypothetical protein